MGDARSTWRTHQVNDKHHGTIYGLRLWFTLQGWRPTNGKPEATRTILTWVVIIVMSGIKSLPLASPVIPEIDLPTRVKHWTCIGFQRSEKLKPGRWGLLGFGAWKGRTHQLWDNGANSNAVVMLYAFQIEWGETLAVPWNPTGQAESSRAKQAKHAKHA